MAVIKIKSTDPATQGDYVLIEEEDFDADKHVKFDPKGAEKKRRDEEVAEAQRVSDEAQAARDAASQALANERDTAKQAPLRAALEQAEAAFQAASNSLEIAKK